MTMGLKIHRMLKEDRKDPPEIVEEAKKRKEVSDNILELIYHKITGQGKPRKSTIDCLDDEEEVQEEDL
jgi:hypothetical protein